MERRVTINSEYHGESNVFHLVPKIKLVSMTYN